MDLTVATMIYGLVTGCVFLGLWLYYDRRGNSGFESERRNVAFRCVVCAHLYSKKGGGAQGECPRCGKLNDRLLY